MLRWVTCWGGLGGIPNGRFCWVKGFWLVEDRLHARVSFDMVAGFSMAPCIWDRASGRHGLGTGGLLECRVCAFGWHAGGGLGGLQNSRYCWVKGFWLPGDHLHGRLSFDMVAGFCGLLECRVCLGG